MRGHLNVWLRDPCLVDRFSNLTLRYLAHWGVPTEAKVVELIEDTYDTSDEEEDSHAGDGSEYYTEGSESGSRASRSRSPNTGRHDVLQDPQERKTPTQFGAAITPRTEPRRPRPLAGTPSAPPHVVQ